MDDSSRSDSRLQLLVRSALLAEWDPIGVRAFAGAQDEYDRYAPDLCRLLVSGADQVDLFEYLWELETGHMGLDGDRLATVRFAARLLEIYSNSLRDTGGQSQ